MSAGARDNVTVAARGCGNGRGGALRRTRHGCKSLPSMRADVPPKRARWLRHRAPYTVVPIGLLAAFGLPPMLARLVAMHIVANDAQ